MNAFIDVLGKDKITFGPFPKANDRCQSEDNLIKIRGKVT
jgi:hypothetical protein